MLKHPLFTDNVNNKGGFMKKFLTILLVTLLVFNSAFTSKLWAEDEVSNEEETIEEVVSEEAEDVVEEEIVEVSELPMADENAAPTVTVVENTKGLLITATGDNAEDFIDLIYKGNMTNELEPDENGDTWHEYSIVYFEGPVHGYAQNEFNIFEDFEYSNIRFEKVSGSSTKLLLPKAMYAEALLEGTYTLAFETYDAYGRVEVEGVAIHTGLTASDYGLKIVDSASTINVEYTVNARIGKKIEESVTITSATGVIDGVTTDITSCINPIVVFWNEDEGIWSNVKYHNMDNYQDGVQYALVLDYKYVYEDLENSIGFSSTHEYPNFIVNGTLVPTMDKEDAYDIFVYEWNPGVQVYYSDDELYMLDMEVGELVLPTATVTETTKGIVIEFSGEDAEE